MLKEFLNYIVAKHISHELTRIWVQFSEDLVFLVAIGRF